MLRDWASQYPQEPWEQTQAVPQEVRGALEWLAKPFRQLPKTQLLPEADGSWSVHRSLRMAADSSFRSITTGLHWCRWRALHELPDNSCWRLAQNAQPLRRAKKIVASLHKSVP